MPNSHNKKKMPARTHRGSNKRQSKRRRGGMSTVPGVSGRVTYSGTVNSNGTLACYMSNVAQDNYRITHATFQLLSEKPTFAQVEIRTEQPDEGFPSPIYAIGPNPRTYKIFQPKTEGWWEGDGSNQAVFWLRNIGPNPYMYNLVVFYQRRDYIKPVTFSTSSSVLPNQGFIQQPLSS